MLEYLILATILGLLFLGIHRKVIARVQGRPGPPVWQEILHTLKFSFKKTWIPKTGSELLFTGIVLVAIGIWTAALFVVIAGQSILLLFGIYMVHKMVEHGVGLSPGSPYSKFGGVRSVISASSEIPLFGAVAMIYFFTGSLMISDIIAFQAENGPLLLIVPPAALGLYVVILSKMPYGPFSIVQGKEIVSGYKTEHFGVWRAALDVGEGLKTFVLLFAFVVIFIGQLPVLLTLVVMLIILFSLSFVCATTPLLSPYDCVTVQILIIVFMAVFAVVLGVLL
jgi:energy-converting hydrogenase A subunit J